jgi:hypothetical protein
MVTHRFSVGQRVSYSPGFPDRAKAGRFEIVRLLPQTGSVFQYRVKSQIDGHERVVREDQLARL